METQKKGSRNIVQVFALLVAAAFLFSCGADQSPVASDTGRDERALAPGDGDLAPAAKKVNAEKAAAREAKAAAREAEREQAKAEKAAAREAKKAARQAEREQAKAEKAAAREAKKAARRERKNKDQALYVETDSGKFSPDRKGKLKACFKNYGEGGDLWVKDVTFEVPVGALDQQRDIAMKVTSGYTLEDVKIDFEPSGTEFHPSARLTIRFWLPQVVKKKLTPERLESLDLMAEHIKASGKVEDVWVETTKQGQAFLTLVIPVPGFSRYGLSGDYWSWINGF